MAPHPLIAVVDDDVSFREAVSGLVRSYGYQTEDHACGGDVLVSGNLQAYDLFVLDMQMPGMSGLDLMRHLRECGVATPVIFLTALRDKGVKARALAMGASAFLDKPFDRDELLACIEAALAAKTN